MSLRARGGSSLSFARDEPEWELFRYIAGGFRKSGKGGTYRIRNLEEYTENGMSESQAYSGDGFVSLLSDPPGLRANNHTKAYHGSKVWLNDLQ